MLSWPTPITNPTTRRVVGLMSGTSLDGIDAALVEISGDGGDLRAELRHFLTVPLPAAIKTRLLRLCRDEVSAIAQTVAEIAALNFELGELFAAAALQAIAACGLTPEAVDLIGSHGQTICHRPDLGATLQLGEPCVIAERTGLTTVAEFRYRDMAAGGQGAPLVPFVDWALLRHPRRHRLIQNIGGIANFTLLLAGAALDAVVAGDTGPGNMVIDECVRLLTNGAQEFDADGALAAQGQVDATWLAALLEHPFFQLPPPKSTGREAFGQAFSAAFVEEGKRRGLSDCDIVATATALTAASIALAYRTLPALDGGCEIVLGGGGAFNPTLLRMLAARVAPWPVRTHEDLGLRSDAKEAVAFALLAHETVLGHPNNAPRATGARHPVVLGKIVPGFNLTPGPSPSKGEGSRAVTLQLD